MMAKTTIDYHIGPALFHDDPIAIRRREALGSVKPITLTEVLAGQVHRPIRIYADGVYDLFHHGHAEQLRQAKTVFPNVYLIVGVCSDADTLKYKGGPTVIGEVDRCASVSHCRYVDEIYANPPYFCTFDFLNEIKADLVAHDAIPYPLMGADDCYAIFKQADRFVETQRTVGVSTTDVVGRIIDNIDAFRRRNEMRA